MYKAKKNLDKSKFKHFNALISGKKIGLFINERYLNLPLKLVPELLRSLPEDIEFTKKQEDVAVPADYDFDYFLGIAKLSAQDLFYKPEEERFVRNSTINFKFS